MSGQAGSQQRAAATASSGGNLMMIQAILLPVFVLVGLTFALLLATGRTGEPNGRAAQSSDRLRDQFELPVLFYVLVALALPLRHADLVMVMLAWVFVVTRFVHAGILLTSENAQQRSLAWMAGVLVLLAMWLYFALAILLRI
jgi:hypothetical protein